MTLLQGCDVSHYQGPSLVDWATQDFGIVKFTDGIRKTKRSIEHIAKIRAAGKVAGGYHFCRVDSTPDAQIEAFWAVARDAGLGCGDLLPCIDIEDYPGHAIAPSDSPAFEAIAVGFEALFGGVVVYTSRRYWAQIGKPSWILSRPLWVAHYPAEGSTSLLQAPATPANMPWRIWQCRVGPLGNSVQDSKHPKAVDQNIATNPLPLIGAD